MAKRTIITRVGGEQFISEIEVPDEVTPMVPEVVEQCPITPEVKEEAPKPKRRSRAKKAEG